MKNYLNESLLSLLCFVIYGQGSFEKGEGFFASNSKYVVCFNKFFAGKDVCEISTLCEFIMVYNCLA